jgi:radical SAM superfamily enzyme YgiQ (UPF0313 family)
MHIVLISTYELGHQPFGLASPAAWLKAAGAQVTCLDLAVEPLRPAVIAAAELVAFYLPMHTATRLAAAEIPRIRQINPRAQICCYGLYAPINETFLRKLGVATILGGEFETGLLALFRRLAATNSGATPPPAPAPQVEPRVLLDLQSFITPDRSGLPDLSAYAHVQLPDGARRISGYTEASRGCKHHCRHCPIVPVYEGRFRIVQREVVLDDIRRQAASGARHITFGDPDFFNGPGHAIPLVQALHAEFPAMTYDVTIKVEHLLRHAALLPVLRDTGCLFVTSAVEAVDDEILAIFAKRHTRDDFIRLVELFNELGLTLTPTFVTFTPWTTRERYHDLLALIAQLGLVEHVAPIQYAIRLLIPAESKLLELAQVQQLVDPFDEVVLCYPWSHPDSGVDRLYAAVRQAVITGQARGLARQAIFEQIWRLSQEALVAAGHRPAPERRAPRFLLPRPPIPSMSEPWYC